MKRRYKGCSILFGLINPLKTEYPAFEAEVLQIRYKEDIIRNLKIFINYPVYLLESYSYIKTKHIVTFGVFVL